MLSKDEELCLQNKNEPRDISFVVVGGYTRIQPKYNACREQKERVRGSRTLKSVVRHTDGKKAASRKVVGKQEEGKKEPKAMLAVRSAIHQF